MQTMFERFEGLLVSCSMKKGPLFSPEFFQTILRDVLTHREGQGWKGNFVQKITLTQQSKVVVFGATQGAYHSLTRDFEELKRLGIIGDDFKVTDSNFYLVFLGNFAHRSPYSLEVFSLLLRLLEQNPTNVIALRGKNEHFYNSKLSLYREIELRFSPGESSVVEQWARNLFQTLPLNLHCVIQPSEVQEKADVNYFELSPSLVDVDRFRKMIGKNESSITSFIKLREQKKLESFYLSEEAKGQEEQAYKDVCLKAVIKDIHKKHDYEEMDGLRLLEWKNDVIFWTVLSTSTEPYQKFCKFFYDAFVVVEPAKKISDWTINLYNRDIRSHDKFFNKRSQYFFTGKEV